MTTSLDQEAESLVPFDKPRDMYKINLQEWEPEDVKAWVEQLDVLQDSTQANIADKVASNASRMGVTGSMLLKLDDECWKELGVESAITRLKLASSIKKVRLETDLAENTQETHAWAYNVPVLNLFYDLLFDSEPPSEAKMKMALDTVGLLAALNLTVAIAMQLSVSFDDLSQARLRWDTPPYKGSHGANYTGDNIITDLTYWVTLSVYALSSSLISVVCMIVVIAITQDCVFEIRRTYVKWWEWARWVFLWSVLSLCTGVMASFFAFNRIMMVKFPDLVIEETGKMMQAPFGILNLRATYGYTWSVGYLLVILPCGLNLLAMGLANRNSYRDVISTAGSIKKVTGRKSILEHIQLQGDTQPPRDDLSA